MSLNGEQEDETISKSVLALLVFKGCYYLWPLESWEVLPWKGFILLLLEKVSIKDSK